MMPPEKRRLVVLGVASALATGGIVWLAVAMAGRAPEWSLAALGNPLAVRCLVFIGAGLAVLGILAALLIRLRPARGTGAPRALHGDQGGTAAIEMAFVFPLALMIFLLITQAALLFNANMVVHYAAFCAARMATVVVPMDLTEEQRNLVWPQDLESNAGNGGEGSEKREMIRRAAVLALVPVSASLTPAGSTVDAGGATVLQETRRVFSYGGTTDETWFRRVKGQYSYANEYTKIELAPPDHWQDGNPDNDCPYHHDQRSGWSQSGWSYSPYCPFYHRVPPIWDYWYWEDLDVRVTYPFLLEVPYASRFLGEEVQVPDRQGKQFAAVIRVVGTLSNEGGPELRPKDYVQP